MQPITKRYITIDSTTESHFNYPADYLESQNLKFVHVLNVTLIVEDNTDNNLFERPTYCQFHASFVQEDPYVDHFVCIPNQRLEQRKKYEQVMNSSGFDYWITDYAGNRMTMNSKTHLLIELMLEY